jgi:5'-nucleotidase (lipoprotein e(P4) family)
MTTTIRPLILVLLCAALAPAQELMNSVVWMQRAIEYRAATTQTYRSAEKAMLKALATPNWTAAIEQSGDFAAKPPAVVLDLDETVLDNSPYQARQIVDGTAFDGASWSAWVAEAKAELLPGAADFLNAAAFHGVRRIYVSNRVCTTAETDPTVIVLRRHGLLGRNDTLMCKASNEETSDKSPRRYRASAGHRILLLIGDDIGDFFTVARDAKARDEALLRYQRWFGDRWFILPNPAYGSWERLYPDTSSKKGALRLDR